MLFPAGPSYQKTTCNVMADHLQSRVMPWRQYASHVKVRGTLSKMDVPLAGLTRTADGFGAIFSFWSAFSVSHMILFLWISEFLSLHYCSFMQSFDLKSFQLFNCLSDMLYKVTFSSP